MSDKYLLVQGCRQHNLKNIGVKLPKHAISTLTGVSGSGKSSLAFDTIHAEAQRRYIECLSPEARRWIQQLPKADLDFIEGLSPSLAVAQGANVASSRAIVASQTDLYDFFCILFARIGEQYSPKTGKRLNRQTRQEIIETILNNYSEGQRIQILAPIQLGSLALEESIARLQHMGFVRLRLNGQEFAPDEKIPKSDLETQLDVVVDRLAMKEGVRDRLTASINTALNESGGIVKIQEGKEGGLRFFTEIYVCPESGMSFPPLDIKDFKLHSALAACPQCQGRGGSEKVHLEEIVINEDEALDKVILAYLSKIPKKQREMMTQTWQAFTKMKQMLPKDRLKDLPANRRLEICSGSDIILELMIKTSDGEQGLQSKWKGLQRIIQEDIDQRRGKSRFRDQDFVQWTTCPECQGGRLKSESLHCKIESKGINDLMALSVDELIQEVRSWEIQGKRKKILDELMPQIINRLAFLSKVGLGYLQLNRQVLSLSEGESQRVLLAAQIGAKLSGVLYVLDEPTRGLHWRDAELLMEVIEELKSLGNTVIAVEHNQFFIERSDYIVELGPGAGEQGGEIIFQGTSKELKKSSEAITGKWWRGEHQMPQGEPWHQSGEKLSLRGAHCHNVQGLNLDIPLRSLVGFCGISGSGKSTVLFEMIAKELKKILQGVGEPKVLSGYAGIKRLVLVDQRKRNLSTRSIPASYVGLLAPLRQLFAETRLAKARGYAATQFSLSRRGGRCDLCEGLGQVKVSMPFMPDIFVDCDICRGRRYNFETLQVTWNEVSIADVLEMGVDEALKLFKNIPELQRRLQLMSEMGLGYLKLGQNFMSLSGGEVQRLHLVSELAKSSQEHTLYILDEPAAALHLADIEKLMRLLHRLVKEGHSVILIEHQLDVLKQMHWLIEMGPQGGPKGGNVVFEGELKDLLKADSETAKALLNFSPQR